MTLFCEPSRKVEIRNLALMLLYCSSQFLISDFKFQAVNGCLIFHEKGRILLDQASDVMKNTG